MVQPIKIRGIEFLDRTGQWRTIYPCSVLNRESLKERINQIWDFIQNYPDNGASFEDLITNESKFRYYCTQALEIAGVDIDWVDYASWHAMVLPYEDDKGEQQLTPILVQLNFGPVKKGSGKEGEEGSTFFDLLASLWTANGSLQEALDVASRLPLQELERILDARAKLIKDMETPEKDKKKHKIKEGLLDNQDKMYSNLPENHPMRLRWEKMRGKKLNGN